MRGIIMLRRIAGLGLLLMASPMALADPDRALPYLDQLPPQLDRQIFFGDPDISFARLSPDGRYMSFIRPHNGIQNIWVKEAGEAFDQARPLTADERPIVSYFWAEDSSHVLYVQDRDGDENFHVWAVDPGETPEDGAVPAARNLTPVDGARAFIYAVPRQTPNQILVGLNDRDPALHDVYRVDIETAERELLIENDQNIASWIADLSGEVRLAMRQRSDGGTEVLRVKEGALGDVLFSCSWQESCSPMRFLPDGKRVWFRSNAGDDVDLIGLYIMDVASGELELFERDPEAEVDLRGAIFSPGTDELLATVYLGDRQRVYPQQDAFAEALSFLQSELKGGDISFTSQTQDERLALVSLSRDVNPGTVYLFDRKARTLEKVYQLRDDVPTEAMAEMQPIRYKARDGLEIPAYLTLPPGVPAENLAVVALIHGGPWARDTWGFRSQVQFLANRGYAVLQPNFRGSDGFGKAFLNAGNRAWGDEMQDDITDGVRYLIEQGIADPSRVCIMGGSYGGYATLAGMTFTPELYACGVNIVGPSNLITLINSIPPYWGPVRETFVRRMGDPDTDEGRAQLERQSPINHVARIQRPLLVIHGANDPRVRQAEADQIVAAMRDRELPVEYLVAPDEGHGFRGLENRLAMFARTEAFLAEHLGGRYQSDMPDDVADRLAAITVDVDSVEVTDLADELAAARTRPLPTVDVAQLALGTFQYQTKMTIQGDDITAHSERRISEVDDNGDTRIEILTTSSGPAGDTRDQLLLDAGNLRPVSRSATQGPAQISIQYESRQVGGEIEAGPQRIPIDIELDAPVFAGETGLEAVLTTLPLAEGYRTPLRTVEVGMQQRVRFWQLEVQGQERIEVPAGSFQAWRVELAALDGEGGAQTVWVQVDKPRVVLRTQGRLPAQMGGGQYVTELKGSD